MKTIPGGLPAIVPIELYERAQIKLATNQAEKSRPHKHPEDFLLKGHIVCKTCNYKMVGRYQKSRNEFVYPYYRCTKYRNKYDACPDLITIHTDKVNQLVWDDCCRVFERLDLIRDTIERNIERSLQIMLEDTRGKQLITRFEQELAHARVERSKHAEGSYLYNLIAATFQEKRNALEVLGVKVYIHPPAETPSRAPVVTEQEWLSIPEASALTGISQPSLFYHIRHETLTAHSRNVPMTVIHRDELARYLKLKRPHVSLEPYDEWFSINKIREAKIANYRPLHRAIRRGEITTHTRDVPHPYIHRDELNRFLTESPVRPKDTLEDIQPRIEITYTPMFTGVQSSFG